MRRRLAAFRERIRSASTFSKVCVATAAIAIAIVTGGMLTKPPTPSADVEPIFTYDSTWNLLQLQQHIEAGDVLAITAHTPHEPGTGRVGFTTLAVETEDGQTVMVETEIAAGDAISALRVLGYGDLLTTEARDAMPSAEANQHSTNSGNVFAGWLGEPWATLFTFVMMAAVGLMLFGIVRRNAGPMSAGPGGKLVNGSVPVGEAGSTAAGTGVAWNDVAGCEEAKLELVEAVEFLKNPTLFSRLGAKVPRGVMLWGPPGTGKTMLAKAAASEAGVPFVQASGSEFVEMFVGRGAARVRNLFAEARKHGKAIVFIDEFDAVGKKRGGANSNDEREQTLNQILVEMDGFDTTDGVIVIAATNRLETLDSAVLRPGRFTRKVNVPLPDKEGREAILHVHAAGKPLAAGVSLADVAADTFGFSGADLANLLNESAILAAREGADAISGEHIHSAWVKVAVGHGRKRSMPLRERALIAAHEAGHALAGRAHGDGSRVHEISLYAHGEALGYTASVPVGDQNLPSERDLRARLIALMGGRAAEELLFHDYTAGARNDFEKATQLATDMVTKYGMGHDPSDPQRGATGRGRLSFIVADETGKISSDLQPAVDRAVAHLLDEAMSAARDTLVEQMRLLRAVSAFLVENERMDGKEFEAICDGQLAVPSASNEWRPEESRPRAWDQVPAFAAALTAQARPLATHVIAAARSEAEREVRSIAPRRAPRRRRGRLGNLLRRGTAAVNRLLDGESDRPVMG